MNTSKDSELLTALVESVKELGADGVVAILKNARKGYLDDKADGIVRAVANYHKISVEEMVAMKNHSHKRKIALAFSVYYLHNSGYSFGAMKKVFSRSRSRLSRLNTMLEDLIDNKDRFVIDTKKELDKIFY